MAVSCIFLFFCKHEKPAARGRTASAQQKARRGLPPGHSGVVSVNTLFWKILVTRVKRKMRAGKRGAAKGQISSNGPALPRG
jgi:hypothetical protein